MATATKQEVCLDCGKKPDAAWKIQGGETDDNIWTTCQSCRACYAIWLKRSAKEEHQELLALSYRSGF